MARRRLTVKRIDPWSVLKFGAVVNLALLAIGLLVLTVVWFIIERLGLVDQACEIAFELGFTACGINASNLFRALVLLGLLAVVVQTAVLVFLSFLHNLIADLTGGLALTVIDETPAPARVVAPGPATTTARQAATGPNRAAPEPRPRRAAPRERSAPPPVPPIGRDEPDATARHQPVGDQPADDGQPSGERIVRRRRSSSASEEDLFGGR